MKILSRTHRYAAGLLLPTMQQFHQSTPPSSISIGQKPQEMQLEWRIGEKYLSRCGIFCIRNVPISPGRITPWICCCCYKYSIFFRMHILIFFLSVIHFTIYCWNSVKVSTRQYNCIFALEIYSYSQFIILPTSASINYKDGQFEIYNNQDAIVSGAIIATSIRSVSLSSSSFRFSN